MKYYVTHYEEYPIYESAEGGYYYAGSQNVEVREFNTWKKAKRYFNKVSKEFMEYYAYNRPYCVYGCPRSYTRTQPRYIGDGVGIVLTYGNPRKEHGYEPYC